MYRVFTVPGHIRIVNDPVELVPLLMTFNDPMYKKVYELLNKSWMTEEEVQAQVQDDNLPVCIQILKKGNLVEEQWRMPKPGKKPEKEFRATYNKFRANFQCNLSDLSDILYLSLSNDENLREVVENIEEELGKGNSSINDLSRKFSVSPVFVKGLAKRIPHMDVKGQGLVLLDTGR
ncbi:MAG: ArsR family transcriptional regulator [Methanomicrobiales archaeon HGW-Methanomicrobiales-3]|jgi:predicted DNA-binding ArsR family transcriptional regulator|nr:MAG: ArsR family transcriptional regulator [Methanomicrobiales archaeon HGW-Methanomicrobiales-3]